MTVTIKNPSTTPSTTSRPGFQPIPSRIRDTRDVPPLVVDPIDSGAGQIVTESLEELGTKLATIHRTSAEAWISQNRYDKALIHLEAAAAFAGNETEYHNQLGFVRYITGNDAGAIASFNVVLASEPNNGEAWFNLGMVLFGQSQFAEAEDSFRRSIESEPNDAQTWNNRGVCLFQLGRKSDAKICFQRALQIDANDQDARANLASIG